MASAIWVVVKLPSPGSSDYRSRIPVFWNGGVAQLGERLLCKQEVIGSIPFTSTRHLHPRHLHPRHLDGCRQEGVQPNAAAERICHRKVIWPPVALVDGQL